MDAFTAEALKSIDEVLDETAGVVIAQLVEAVGLGHAELAECIVGENSALEGIQEADAEVVSVALCYGGVGAGDADGGDARSLKGGASGNGDAGAVGAENDGAACADEFCRSGRGLVIRRLIIDILDNNIVGLATDLYGGLNGIGVLDTEGLLLAAGSVIAGSGLENADGDCIVGSLGSAAGGQCKDKCQGQY